MDESTTKKSMSALMVRFYCVGHSLGTHVCGVVADELEKLSEKTIHRVQRITGLDPARPCFGNLTSYSLKLDKTSAPLGDIIHEVSRQYRTFGYDIIL